MKSFVYPNVENGGVIICSILDESLNPFETISKDGFIINDDDIPKYANQFFNAVEMNDSKLVIHLDKAKDITKDRLRYERIPILNHLDVLYQRGIESAKCLKPIEIEKQRMRDITSIVNDCNSIDELLLFKCESSLQFEHLNDAIIDSDNVEILNLQKQNEQLKLDNQSLTSSLQDLNTKLTTLTTILKKKFII